MASYRPFRRSAAALVLALAALLAPAAALAKPDAPPVVEIARFDDPFVDWLTGKSSSDTTGLRKESKMVVSAKAAAAFIEQLERDVGKLDSRDATRRGEANLNETQYLDVGKGVLEDVLGYEVEPPAESISAKIRIRKYVQRDAKGNERDAIVTKGFSFLEVKLPHPTLPAVALKPRLIINDAQLEILMEKGLFYGPGNLAAARKILLADARNAPGDVDRILDVFAKLHEKLPKQDLRSWMTTRYVRTAYRVPLKGKDGKSVDVQLTVDKELTYLSPDGERVASYPKTWRAVEIKVPVDLAGLTDAELTDRGLDGLVKVRQATTTILEPGRVAPERVPAGKGKSGLFKVIDADAAAKLRRTKGWKKPKPLRRTTAKRAR